MMQFKILTLPTMITMMMMMMILIIVACCAEQQNLNIEVEAPDVLSYNSPLRSPDSLKSRPYFDFLSMLYRHDATKSELFRPYQRTKRFITSSYNSHKNNKTNNSKTLNRRLRKRRAIVFRPLFVYRQQQRKRQSIQSQQSPYQYQYRHQYR